MISRMKLAVLGLVTLGVAAGAVLYDPRPDVTEALRLHNSININACWNIRNGKLRLQDINGNCRRNELPITWPAVCCGVTQ